MNVVVLDGYTLNPGDLSWKGLESLGALTVYDRTPPELILERAEGAGAVLVNKVALSAATLQALKSVRYAGVLATGYDMVDVRAARELGITVTNVPSYGTDSVAQLTIALLLELCHQAAMHSAAVRAGEWSRSKDWCFWRAPLVELAGKRIGVIGLGRIGGRVAQIAAALGMSVLATGEAAGNRRTPSLGIEVQWVPLEELLTQADVVTLHCPLTPVTKDLINANRLALMKPTAFLINTSRGGLIADQDLAEALNYGRLAGAGLDVLGAEPPPPGNPLLRATNCITTPHLAWATREARARLMQAGAENLAAFQQGQPRNVVST